MVYEGGQEPEEWRIEPFASVMIRCGSVRAPGHNQGMTDDGIGIMDDLGKQGVPVFGVGSMEGGNSLIDAKSPIREIGLVWLRLDWFRTRNTSIG
jgi:hypothetical protein